MQTDRSHCLRRKVISFNYTRVRNEKRMATERLNGYLLEARKISSGTWNRQYDLSDDSWSKRNYIFQVKTLDDRKQNYILFGEIISLLQSFPLPHLHCGRQSFGVMTRNCRADTAETLLPGLQTEAGGDKETDRLKLHDEKPLLPHFHRPRSTLSRVPAGVWSNVSTVNSHKTNTFDRSVFVQVNVVAQQNGRVYFARFFTT